MARLLRSASQEPYKVAGKSSDGVRILEPKTKPTHFTSQEMRSTVAAIKRDAATGRFSSHKVSREGRRTAPKKR